MTWDGLVKFNFDIRELDSAYFMLRQKVSNVCPSSNAQESGTGRSWFSRDRDIYRPTRDRKHMHSKNHDEKRLAPPKYALSTRRYLR